MAFREIGAAEEINLAAVFDHEVTALALRAGFDPIRFGVSLLFGGRFIFLAFDVMAGRIATASDEGVALAVFSLNERFAAFRAHFTRLFRGGFRFLLDVFALRIVRASNETAIPTLFHDQRRTANRAHFTRGLSRILIHLILNFEEFLNKRLIEFVHCLELRLFAFLYLIELAFHVRRIFGRNNFREVLIENECGP